MYYSQELIDNIVKSRLHGETTGSLGEECDITEATIEKWTKDYILKRIKEDSYFKHDKTAQIPVFESATDGAPSIATECPIGYIDLLDLDIDPKDCFALLARDESMEPDIHRYDVAIIRKQPYVNSGDCAAVQIGHDDAVLRNVKLSDAGLTLGFMNKRYVSALYPWTEVERIPVKIIGRVMQVVRYY